MKETERKEIDNNLEEKEEIIKTEELDDEELLNRIQIADIRLEQLEDISVENRTVEQEQEYKELKQLVKKLTIKRKELKNSKNDKQKESVTVWDKINPLFVIYGVASFLLVLYPLGTLLSAHWANISLKMANALNDAFEMGDGLFSAVNFILYLLYYLVFILGIVLIYVFNKKNKINFWSFIVILAVLIIASSFSVIKVIGVFFQ